MEEQQQHWLFVLSAPMVSLNHHWGARYYLPTFGPADGAKFEIKSSWNVTDRAGLLRMIARMIDNGHAKSLQSHYSRWHHRMPGESLLQTPNPTDFQRITAEFVERTAPYCGPGGIQAWDIGRCSFLARVGQLNGWLTLKENLWLHSRFALRARYYYRDWPQYMMGFIQGHGYWRYEADHNDEGEAERLLELGSTAGHQGMMDHLLGHEDRPFAHLPWNLILAAVDKPDSLQEMDWE